MNNRKLSERLFEYNAIMKESDNLFRNAAKILGLSDCAFWILYTLRADSSILTQSEICSIMYQPKQTVNSALKKLESKGYINLLHLPDHRSKKIMLTDKGIEFSKNTVDKFIDAERTSLALLSDEEYETFIGLMRKYTNLLSTNINKLTKENKEI